MAEYDEINPAEVLNVELAAYLSIHGSPFLLVEGDPVPAADITPRELLRQVVWCNFHGESMTEYPEARLA